MSRQAPRQPHRDHQVVVLSRPASCRVPRRAERSGFRHAARRQPLLGDPFLGYPDPVPGFVPFEKRQSSRVLAITLPFREGAGRSRSA